MYYSRRNTSSPSVCDRLGVGLCRILERHFRRILLFARSRCRRTCLELRTGNYGASSVGGVKNYTNMCSTVNNNNNAVETPSFPFHQKVTHGHYVQAKTRLRAVEMDSEKCMLGYLEEQTASERRRRQCGVALDAIRSRGV